VLLFVLTGCGSGDTRPDQTRRSGSASERVSPVRAAEINTRLGVGYLERGDLQVALEKLQLAARQDPGHAPAHLSLGVVYQSIGREEKALEHMRTAVRLAPDDGGAHNSYAVMLCRVERFDEADRHFRKALEDPFYQTPEVILANAGSCARRAGKLDDAEAYLREALSYNPGNREALYNMAELSLRRGNALSARAFLQRLESRAALSPQALLLGFRVEQALGSDLAEQYATRLRERFPDTPQAAELRPDNQN